MDRRPNPNDVGDTTMTDVLEEDELGDDGDVEEDEALRSDRIGGK